MLILQIITIYLIFSFWEWFLHSNVMHGNPQFLEKIPVIGVQLRDICVSHNKHHRSVEMDMSLSYDVDIRSLYFAWNEIFLISILCILPSIYLFVVRDFKKSLALTIVLSILYAWLWNNIHINMHHNDHAVTISEGVPNNSPMLSKGPIYNYLRRYHTVHHSQKGVKYNHNVVLPGMDHLFGTYQGFYYDNNDYCEEHHIDTRCFENKEDII